MANKMNVRPLATFPQSVLALSRRGASSSSSSSSSRRRRERGRSSSYSSSGGGALRPGLRGLSSSKSSSSRAGRRGRRGASSSGGAVSSISSAVKIVAQPGHLTFLPSSSSGTFNLRSQDGQLTSVDMNTYFLSSIAQPHN